MKRTAQVTTTWVVVTLITLAAAGGLAYLAYQFARPSVIVTSAVEGPVVQAFYSTGTVSPERDYPIKANLKGIITELRVDKGSRVKAGDLLAMVTDPEMEFRAKQAAAELQEKQALADEKTSPILAEFDARIRASKELLEIAEREQRRVLVMLEKNAASQTDVDRAMDRVRSLWSEGESLKAQREARKLQLLKDVQVAQAALDIANWNVELQKVKSPVDGVVLDRPLSLGTRVAVNDHLMLIADVHPDNLVMRAAVDEEDKNKVHDNQLVRMTLYSYPGQVFDGHVTRIYDQADSQRRTFEIDVTFDQPDQRLSPGMTGELAFIMAAKDQAVVVPSQAVQGGVVWLVRDGQLVRADATIGLRSIERTEVEAGIPVGSTVVISPIGSLTEGKSVRTQYMDPIEAAGLNKPKTIDASFKGFN